METKKFLRKLHWIIWIASVLYSLWKFRKASEQHFFSLNHSDFEDGWLIINRPKDGTDFEWVVLTSTFKKYWPLLLFQVVISEILRRTFKNVLPFWYAIYSILCLTIIVGEKATFIFISYIVIMFAIHGLGKKSYCYVLTACALILKNSSYIVNIKASVIQDEMESFLFDVALTWIMAKCLSFMVDRINSGSRKSVTVTDFSLIVSYCLYLPSVFTGPILAYEPFVEQMFRFHASCTLKAFFQKVMHFIYILLWYFIFEIMLHFIYSSSIQYYPEVASEFDSWSLCGLGYALPVMFYLKYFIIYSIVQSIARFENFEFPPPPKCISCIHLSSHLWRHFDRGLYLWILKYLYHPLMQRNFSMFRKLYALGFSFAFVCLWHNVDKAICIWTFLNFILMSSEMFLQALFSAERRKRYLPTFLYGRRAQAVLGTPHFIMMCISSTFFLSNWDIGVLLFQRVMFSGIFPLMPILLIMYCGCEVSLDVRQWGKNQHHCSSVFQKLH